MRLISTVFVVMLMALSATFAEDNKHVHGREDKPKHGGLVTEIWDMVYELVAKPEVLQLYVRDHGKPIDVSKATAKLTLLSGSEKHEVELRPVGGMLEAKGDFKLKAGTKIVAQVNISGKAAIARFVLK